MPRTIAGKQRSPSRQAAMLAEYNVITKAILVHGGKTKAAKALGLHKSGLYMKLKVFEESGLQKPEATFTREEVITMVAKELEIVKKDARFSGEQLLNLVSCALDINKTVTDA
jgi:hypothetical protein